MARKRFIVFVVLLILALLFLAGFNYKTDAYGIFGNNTSKQLPPGVDFVFIQQRKQQVVNPDIYILGNSTSIYSYSKDMFSDAGEVFNYSIYGANTYMHYRLLQNIPDLKEKRLLLHLDYFTFFTKRETYLAKLGEYGFNQRLAVDEHGSINPGYYPFVLGETLDSLLSLDILLANIQYLQSPPEENFSDRYGFVTYQHWLSTDRKFPRQAHEKVLQQAQAGFRSEFLDYLEKILDLAYENSMQVDIILVPYHVSRLEALVDTAHVEDFLDWKRSIFTIVEKLAEKPGRAAYPVWDFSFYNEYTRNYYQYPGEGQLYQGYFSDVGHYNREYGKKMLGLVLHGHTFSGGQRLHKENLEDLGQQFWFGHEVFSHYYPKAERK